MFDFLKKKRGRPPYDPERTEEVVRGFGAVIEKIDLNSFYDVSQLPYEKDEILTSLLTAIRLAPDDTTWRHLETALILLAQFQEDVGPHPISPLPIDLAALSKAQEAGEITLREEAAIVGKAGDSVDKGKLALLKEKCDAESQLYIKLLRG